MQLAAAVGTDLLAITGIGVVAGLAVAVPLGPIGLLILDRSMAHGRRVGVAAAAGVAFVDAVYAAVAVVAGAAVADVVEPVRTQATLVAAVVIATLGVRGLLVASRHPVGAGDDADDAAGRAGGASPLRTFAAFVGLTAINPTTVLYFAALAIGLSDRLTDASSRVAFAAAITLASFSWQCALVGVGGLLGRIRRPSLRRRTRQLGSALLLVFAVALALDAT